MSLYDAIGVGYANTRREDPLLYNRILHLLGDAKSVVNIGAGAGSYEPRDREVLAVEPSEVMIKQRNPNAARAIQATADKLPLENKSFDAAMAVITLHHWHPRQREGLQEMKRVARKRIVIVTIDPRVSNQMWLMKDYLHETAKLDEEIMPNPEKIAEWLDCETKIETFPVSKDCPDWYLLSFWAHPKRVLDPQARAGTSGFSRQPKEVIDRVVSDLDRDLKNGTWDKKNDHLRNLSEFDAGLRIITGIVS